MPARSKKSVARKNTFVGVLKKPVKSFRVKTKELLLRRPHRSFRLTRRRDYNRSLKLPGYISFTNEVRRTLKQYRKTFLFLTLFYVVAFGLLVGLGSQDAYSTLGSALTDTGSEVFEGNWAQLGTAGLLVVSIMTNGLNPDITDAQQIYSVLLGLLVWLSTVWLLRNLLAGHKVRMRDGLYNAGAPIVPSLLVSLALVVQMFPVGLAVIGYVAATSSGLLTGGVEAMLFWIAAAFLTALSLYWITSTFFALIIVTLPGMYPMRALRTAGDMMVGRRIRILLRLAWLALTVLVGWMIVMIPIILLDAWLKGMWEQIESVPIVPVTLLILTTISLIWVSSYIYLLYRKVVDDDAKPA